MGGALHNADTRGPNNGPRTTEEPTVLLEIEGTRTTKQPTVCWKLRGRAPVGDGGLGVDAQRDTLSGIAALVGEVAVAGDAADTGLAGANAARITVAGAGGVAGAAEVGVRLQVGAEGARIGCTRLHRRVGLGASHRAHTCVGGPHKKGSLSHPGKLSNKLVLVKPMQMPMSFLLLVPGQLIDWCAGACKAPVKVSM